MYENQYNLQTLKSYYTRVGSTPADRIKNTGVVEFIFFNVSVKSVFLVSMYFDPNFSSMKHLCNKEY